MYYKLLNFILGKVWMGSFKQPKGRRWVFGQYDDIVLPTVLYVLDLSQLPHSDRGNPIHLTRAISAIVSTNKYVKKKKKKKDLNQNINLNYYNLILLIFFN